MNRNVSRTARLLGVDVQQVKNWAWLFKEYLSNGANPGKGRSRAFTDHDVLTLIHVALHWEGEPDVEAIRIGLDYGNHDEYRHFLYQNTPILQDPPEDLDETWTHGILLNGGGLCEYLELARNYKRSADALLDSALKAGEARDWGSPVLFAYRHALELYLKIIGRNEELTHSLRGCVEQIEKQHQQKIGSPVREWILEFDKIDPRGTTFRYADEEAGTLQYTEFWVDFMQLKYAMGVVFEALDRAVWTLESHKDLPEPSWCWRGRKR